MKYQFSLVYDLDTTLACAVAAYLDGEHYIFLHHKYSDKYEVLEYQNRILTVRQSWKLLGMQIGQVYTAEYIPPARFKNYNVKPYPWFIPSIHHLICVTTDLKYAEDLERNVTVSALDVEIEMPWWLYPWRSYLQKLIEKLKIEKDAEDMEMIKRREKLFGRGNIAAYLPDHQFMIHKDDFVRFFGS